ncbi:TPA: hypothetical protein PFE81_003102 [Vibrio cholerae]|nr:hypothetical protein [Vibrio cholerae]
MTTQFRRVGTGGGISGNDAKVLDKLSYDEPTDTIIADSSLQVKPSTVYLGSAFGMSNAVQAVGFRLADGTDALCLVNRFDKDGGSYSNPKFFALQPAETLNVNLGITTTLTSPIEVSYTTAGDNLTYSFEIRPASAGRLRVQYWLGEDTAGAPIVDFHKDITQEDVDSNQPIEVTPNFYVLTKGSPLKVLFTGIDLYGIVGLPWFRSKILPYKEVPFSGHCDYMNATSDNRKLYIGGRYFADVSQGNVQITVPVEFKDTFTITDLGNNFTGNRYAEVDFSAFGQYKFRLVNALDDVEFFRMKAGTESERWWYRNHRDGALGRVPTGTGVIGTIPAPIPPQIVRDMGIFPSSGERKSLISYRGYSFEVKVTPNNVFLSASAADRFRYTGIIQSGTSENYRWNGLTTGTGLQIAALSRSGGTDSSALGKLILSTVGSTEAHVTVEWMFQNNDSDEYAYFVKLE